MKTLNPNHIRDIMDLINHAPFFELLSMKVCEISIGYSKVEIDLERKHLNPFGTAHGGVYSSIIDTAAYLAVYCEMDENVGFTSLDLKVDNLSMLKEGKIVAEGNSLKVGRSICLSEATVKDINGKLLAHGTSKLMIVEGMQSINHAVTAMGYDKLPPKFIS